MTDARPAPHRATMATVGGGILACLANAPFGVWPLLLVALVPFLWALSIEKERRGSPWRQGVWFGLTATISQLFVVGVTPPILVAGIADTIKWALLAPLLARCLERGVIVGALGAGGVVAAGEIIFWHVVPMFGTAPS